MSWSKEQFIEFCTRCGVDPKKALKEGKVNLRGHNHTWTTLGGIKHRQLKKKNEIKVVHQIQDSLREPDQAVALDKTVCGQAEGMECAKVKFRISIIGYRVKPIDPDNFTAGCKGLIDGLVESGIIEGDNWKTVELTTAQRKVDDWAKEGTEIEIETLS